MTDSTDKVAIREGLEDKIRLLNRATWESRVNNAIVKEWVYQFEEAIEIENDEQIQALFLLSHFLYFGQSELRYLLKSLYRDLIRSPTIHSIRRENSDTMDYNMINHEYQRRLAKMRFLAVGNPAESGMHLLYYFRQENALPINLFINTHEIFGRNLSGDIVETTIRNPEIDQYVFVDDLCGSGTQAGLYSDEILIPLRKLSDKVKVSYFVLFATSEGLRAVRKLGHFNTVSAVYELDETFRVLEQQSRIFRGEDGPFDRLRIREMCLKYGKILAPDSPLGFRNGQLLIGFNHNTPDNTLPIIWGGDGSMTHGWKAIFPRYDKVYE